MVMGGGQDTPKRWMVPWGPLCPRLREGCRSLRSGPTFLPAADVEDSVGNSRMCVN